MGNKEIHERHGNAGSSTTDIRIILLSFFDV